MRVDRLALVQWLALATMFVGHLGAMGYLSEWARIPGRFAVPAFVFMLAYNALHTQDPARLLTRMLWLLLLSQPMWALSVGDWERYCILVTLAVVVALVWAYRERRFDLGLLVLLFFIWVAPWVEYGVLPLLLLPVVLLPSWSTLALALLWPFAQYDALVFQLSALFSVVALVALVRVPFDVPRAPRWLSRSFYPAHLGALALLPLVYEVIQ